LGKWVEGVPEEGESHVPKERRKGESSYPCPNPRRDW